MRDKWTGRAGGAVAPTSVGSINLRATIGACRRQCLSRQVRRGKSFNQSFLRWDKSGGMDSRMAGIVVTSCVERWYLDCFCTAACSR